MRVVVTGATSMIGAALIEICVQNNVEVMAICRPGTDRLTRLPDSELVKVEYSSLNSLDSVTGDKKDYDVFYHFAWDYTSKDTRDNPVLQNANVGYTLDAVLLAKKLGCRKFIGAGSQAEYGIVESTITENTECKPIIAYGIAKLSASMLARRLCEQIGIDFIWTRIFSVYGVNDNANTMIDYALTRFYKGEKASFSKAINVWNYLFESDAGKAFFLLGEKNVDKGIYCVASDECRLLREYVIAIAELFGKTVDYSFAEQGESGPNLKVDISRLKREAGFVPKVEFKDGIKKIMEARKMNEKGKCFSSHI